MTMLVCEITDILWLEGNSITGSLESFCSTFTGGVSMGDDFSLVADCLETMVNCSCCTKCCDEDDYCSEEAPT